MNIKIGTALIYASFFQHGIFLVLHVIQFLVFAAKPDSLLFFATSNTQYYLSQANKYLGKAAALDLLRCFALNLSRSLSPAPCVKFCLYNPFKVAPRNSARYKKGSLPLSCDNGLNHLLSL